MDDNCCSICHEPLTNNESQQLFSDSNFTLKTRCGHRFHNDCLSKWYLVKQDCPYCRRILFYENFDQFCFPQRYETNITYKKYKRKSQIVNNNILPYIEKELKYNTLAPAFWLQHKSRIRTFNEKIFEGLYKIPFLQDTIYVTSYTRLVLIHNDDKNGITLDYYRDLNKNLYYSTENELKYMKKHVFIILIEWIYELLGELKKEYTIDYYSEYYTIIIDLVIETVKYFEIVNIKLIQGIAICAIYNTINLDNIFPEINMEHLNYYTCNSYNVENLEKYIKYQNNFLIENINVNVDSWTIMV